jgi:hypothetical protein
MPTIAITKIMTLTVGSILAAAFLLAGNASADTKYCDAVVEKYERYLAGSPHG